MLRRILHRIHLWAGLTLLGGCLMLRRILHRIHLWAGLTLCIPLVMLGITGSILVFQHELENSVTPHPVMAVGNVHSAGEIIDAARAAAPDGFSPSMFHPGDTGEPAAVYFSKTSRKKPASGGQGARVQMLVDPVSLVIITKDSSGGFIHQIHDLHANLMLRDYGGRNIVGWFGVAMLAFGISGLILWWPRRGNWKQAFTIKQGTRGFRLHRDLHGVTGIWGLAVFITVSFSGVYLAFPQAMDAAFSVRDLRSPPAIESEPVEGQVSMPVDEVIRLAQRTLAGSKMVSVTLPAKPEQPYRVSLLHPDDREGAPVTNIFIDPWAKQIIEVRDPSTYTAGEKLITWQHALHSGHGFGWLWKALVFAMGFMPLLFSFTGISMWLIKKRKNGMA